MAMPSMTTDGREDAAAGHPAGIVAESPDAREHADDVAGQRDLAHRRRELAALDEDAADAHGELARDGVGAGVHADGVGDEHAALEAGDDVGQRRHRARDDEVGGPHAGQAGVGAAQAVAGGAAAGLARRVGVVEEALQHAAADERRAPAGRALAVERRAVEAVGQRAVVDELEELAGHLLALAAGEQRAALLHGVGGERRAEHAEEGGRDERVEHDGRLHRGALAGAEQPAGALGGLARRRRPGRAPRARGRRVYE